MATKIQQIQEILGVVPDDVFGPKSQAALDALLHHEIGSRVMASSFADPADVRRFKVCKAEGKSDQECFKVGDNGIGKWGDDTTGPTPMCALPPDDWEQFGRSACGKKVLVTANGREVVCELRDTMPRRRNITNGAGIDLNPAAVKALGLTPPIMVLATWKWV